MRRILIVILALPLLAACGPKTITSMLFPTRYGATTVVDFQGDGRDVRQAVVTRCRIIDQSDSVSQVALAIDARGEPHWLRRTDGSLWILGPLEPCRWGVEGPRGHPAYQPIQPVRGDTAPPGVHRLSSSLTYRIDDPSAPRRADAYRTEALFDGGADGLQVRAQLAPVGEEVTDTLSAVLRRPAAVPKVEGRRGDWSTRFLALTAEVYDMSAEPCQAAGSARAVVMVDPRACNPERGIRLGGLRPEVSSDFGVLSFATGTLDPAYVGGFFHGEGIRRAGGPGEWRRYQMWTPRVCLDDLCQPPSNEWGAAYSFYLPARAWAVLIRRQVYDLPVGSPKRS